MRHPAITTTAEEDLRALGLMNESDDTDQGEPIEELHAVRTHKGTSSEKRAWRKAKKKPHAKMQAKKHNRKSSVQRLRKKQQKATHGKTGRKHVRRMLGMGNDTVSTMLENTQTLLESLNQEQNENAIKAFAHLAILAEMLARSFNYISEDIGTNDEERATNLSKASEFYGEMAEEAADIAKALREGEEADEAGMADYFRSKMAALLDGLDAYSELTDNEDDEDTEVSEASNDDEEEDDDSDDDDDDDEDDSEDEDDEVSEAEECDDDDEDDDSDDDDDKEEPKKKLPPFMMKGKK
jgi:myosin heavy subunit